MTETPNPLIAEYPYVPSEDYDAREVDLWRQEALAKSAARLAECLPARFEDATATEPVVIEWVRELVASASNVVRTSTDRTPYTFGPAVFRRGPSLLMLGPTGTGKTHQAWGAMRALALSGVLCSRWEFVTAADMYASLRPRPGVDTEEVMGRYREATVLVLDDLGAAKNSEFVEDVNLRIVNHRYAHALPTLITSNLRPTELRGMLGDRTTSRLAEMTRRVVLVGDDRRRAK